MGCFGRFGASDIHRLDYTLTKEKYHSIIQNHAIPSGLGLTGKGFIFQQNNDHKHTVRLNTTYFNRKSDDGAIQILIWPPQSLDLNPIEMVWDELDHRAKRKRPNNSNQILGIPTVRLE